MKECPNCFVTWGIEEVDWNRCHCCGYPDHEKGNEDEGGDYIDEEIGTD